MVGNDRIDKKRLVDHHNSEDEETGKIHTCRQAGYHPFHSS